MVSGDVKYGNVEWAMNYARDYRNENQAKVAFRALADEIISLRAENKLFRELVGQIRRDREFEQ